MARDATIGLKMRSYMVRDVSQEYTFIGRTREFSSNCLGVSLMLVFACHLSSPVSILFFAARRCRRICGFVSGIKKKAMTVITPPKIVNNQKHCN
jgi:hypothetical protein